MDDKTLKIQTKHMNNTPDTALLRLPLKYEMVREIPTKARPPFVAWDLTLADSTAQARKTRGKHTGTISRSRDVTVLVIQNENPNSRTLNTAAHS